MTRLVSFRAAAFAFLGLFALVFARPALGHTRSETHANWVIAGPTVRLTFTIPDIETRRLAKNGVDPSVTEEGGYVAQHVGVTAAGAACPEQGPARPSGSAEGYRRYEVLFACPTARDIAVTTNAFFDIVPTHVNLAQIQTDDGNFIEQLATADARTLHVNGEGAGNELKSASFFKYIQLGVMHIFTGVDHQLFLVGLILLSRKLRDLIFVITGFTIGHSITLALAVTGVLRPHAEYIDSLIGLTIALVGLENVSTVTRRPGVVALAISGLLLVMAAANLMGFVSLPTLLLVGGAIFGGNYLMVSGHLRDAGRLRLLVTLIFGLIHGFGFAANLLEMQIPKERLAELLVGFNLGVEIGQLTLVLVVTGLAALLVKFKLALPRPLVADFGAAFLVGIGLFWFVSRGYSAGGGAHMG